MNRLIRLFVDEYGARPWLLITLFFSVLIGLALIIPYLERQRCAATSQFAGFTVSVSARP